MTVLGTIFTVLIVGGVVLATAVGILMFMWMWAEGFKH